MSILQLSNTRSKKFFKRLCLILLLVIFYTGSLPWNGVISYLQEENIVDVLYQSMKSSEIVDKAFSPIGKAYADGATDAMMVYDTQTVTSTPKYREWNGSAWGSEASANGVNGEIRHMQVKYAPTRDEAIMVVLTSTGEIQAQVWNGSSWGSVTTLGTHTDINGSRDTLSLYRGFDIEYEQSSGDAIVVYGDGTADPDYKVWNGSTWSGATNIDIATTREPNWIELAVQPGADNMGLILVDGSIDVYGMRWNGSAWDDMNAGGTEAVWDTTAGTATRKCVDVAFEATSGDLLFAWADGTATTHLNYRTYSGTTLSAVTTLANANQGGIGNWVRLASNPTSGSDQVMLGEIDAGADLNTYMWSGTAWSAVHAEHSAATENVIDMNFDIVFETSASNPNDAWLVFGNGTTFSRRLWDGGTSAWQTATTSDDDTAVPVLNSHPNSGAVFALVYDTDTATNDDIRELHLTGGSQTWSSTATIWGGPVARLLGFTRMAVASQAFNSSTEAMMAYDTQTMTATPKYRRWTGSWGSEANATNVDGEIRHMVLKFAPNRTEAILSTLSSQGTLQAQVWNGTSWGSPTLITTMNDANGNRDAQSLMRGFDLEYEQSSGDAVIVYNDTSSDPNYRVWNGTSWSGETVIPMEGTTRSNWIEVAGNIGSSSDNLAMIMVDGNTDIYGMYWTGSAWDDMNAGGTEALWDATGSSATRKSIDVAFERSSGDVLFAWGDGVATTHWNYRTYSGGTLSAVTALANANQGGINNWLRLVANPGSSSNEIMLGGLDVATDLNTARWSGTAWSAVDTEHTGLTEDILDMNFDIVYETHASNPNVAWFAYGDGNLISRKRWSGSAWESATTAGDDTAYVRLNAHPNSGAVLQVVYEDDISIEDDIDTYSITGGGSTWSSASNIWTGPVRRNLGLTLMDIASERHIASSNPTFTLSSYRLYVDPDAENVTDPWGNPDLAENTALTILPATNSSPQITDELRLRVAITIGTANLSVSAKQFKLQYKAGTDGSCTSGSWTDVGAGGGASIWRFATSSVTDGADLTVAKLTVSDVLQEYAKANPTQTNHNSATIGQDIEYDFHIEHNGAGDGATYSFRVVESDDTVFATYTNCPTLTTRPGTANLLHHGRYFSNEVEGGSLWAN